MTASTSGAAVPASTVRLVGSLGLAGLLSGLILVWSYLATAPRIARNHREALEAAVTKVLPSTVRIEPLLRGDDGRLTPTTTENSAGGDVVFSGRDADGRLVGYAIPAHGPGYMDRVGLLFGYDPARQRIVGMEVLDSRETPGLGDRIATDPHFRANFADLAVAPRIVAVKKGDKTAIHEVDCITGATISSEAVVAILNRGLERWRADLDATVAAEETH
jgi:Na+-translocating ferredoxin:NAD+ oxidoreductase subunit G